MNNIISPEVIRRWNQLPPNTATVIGGVTIAIAGLYLGYRYSTAERQERVCSTQAPNVAASPAKTTIPSADKSSKNAEPSILAPTQVAVENEEVLQEWAMSYEVLPFDGKPTFNGKRLEQARQFKRWAEAPEQQRVMADCQTLDLTGKKLTYCPSIILSFRNLQGLFLGYNSLKTFPEAVCDLTLLEGLALHCNHLVEISPKIGQLTRLKKLSLQNNQLTTLPREMENLRALTTLYIENNPFSTYPPVIRQLPALTDIDRFDLPSKIFDSSPHQKHLDEQLRLAIKQGTISACRAFVKEGANLRAKNERGETLFKEALSAQDIQKCKFLIDNGAHPDAEDSRGLSALLAKHRAHVKGKDPTAEMKTLMLRRPPPNQPEIFLEGTFHSLQTIFNNCPQVLKNFKKNILLLNIADEPFSNASYGPVSNKFDPSLEKPGGWYPWLAKTHTVVRALVNKRRELISIPQRLKHYLPELSIVHLALDGHANWELTETGTKDCLEIRHTRDMEEIAARVDPLGVLSLLGCECGKEVGKRVNLANKFSQYAKGRIVIASPILTTDIKWKKLEVHGLEYAIPFFQSEESKQPETRAYLEGRCIASGSLDDAAVFDSISAALNKRTKKQRKRTGKLKLNSEMV